MVHRLQMLPVLGGRVGNEEEQPPTRLGVTATRLAALIGSCLSSSAFGE